MMADSDSSRSRMALISRYCGEMKAEPRIMGGRVIDYRYVSVGGCGWLNRPDDTHCAGCGKELRNARN
jgi:hypothetical protein